MNELAKSKDDLTSHFIEEVKVRKRIHELEQKLESASMAIQTKKNDLQQASKDKGKYSISAKLIADEIDETNNQMRELKTQLDNNNTKMISLVKRRDNFNGEWRHAGHRELATELLSHIMKENIILVENLEFQRKEQKADL